MPAFNDLNIKPALAEVPIAELVTDDQLHQHPIRWADVDELVTVLQQPRSWAHRYRAEVVYHDGVLTLVDGWLMCLAYQRLGHETIPARVYRDVPPEAWAGLRFRDAKNPRTRNLPWAKALVKRFDTWLRGWLRKRVRPARAKSVGG